MKSFKEFVVKNKVGDVMIESEESVLNAIEKHRKKIAHHSFQMGNSDNHADAAKHAKEIARHAKELHKHHTAAEKYGQH